MKYELRGDDLNARGELKALVRSLIASYEHGIDLRVPDESLRDRIISARRKNLGLINDGYCIITPNGSELPSEEILKSFVLRSLNGREILEMSQRPEEFEQAKVYLVSQSGSYSMNFHASKTSSAIEPIRRSMSLVRRISTKKGITQIPIVEFTNRKFEDRHN